MDGDVLFLMGVIFMPLAFVALVAAWADRRTPWAGLILVAMGVAMMGWAQFTHPGAGYSLAGLPDLAVETVARYTR